MLKAWCCLEEVPYCFSRSFVKFQGHMGQRNHRFWHKLGVSGVSLHFELINGNEIMLKAWSNIDEVPCCFYLRPSSSKNTYFRPSVTLSVCLSFLTMFLSSYHLEIFRSYYHRQMWGPCKRSRSKVKVTEVMTSFSRLRTVTPVWIQIWQWNDAKSLMLLRRGALLFFKVIRQISRSHGAKNRRIWPRLGVSGLYLQFEFINGYEMLHKAWSSIVEVPYCFSRSSVKFQGRTALKIVKFDQNWAFPDCNSSLNSPMDSKWCI